MRCDNLPHYQYLLLYWFDMGEVFSKQRGQKIRNKSKGEKLKWNRDLEYGENTKANKPQAYLGPLWQTKKLVLDFLFYKPAQWCAAHYGYRVKVARPHLSCCSHRSGKNKAKAQITCAKSNIWTAIANIWWTTNYCYL